MREARKRRDQEILNNPNYYPIVCTSFYLTPRLETDHIGLEGIVLTLLIAQKS